MPLDYKKKWDENRDMWSLAKVRQSLTSAPGPHGPELPDVTGDVLWLHPKAFLSLAEAACSLWGLQNAFPPNVF